MIQKLGRTALLAPVDIAGLPLHAWDRGSLIETVASRAAFGLPTRIGYVNAHTCNLTVKNPRLRRLIAENDILYADGMSLVWASWLLGQPLPERLSLSTYIVDLMSAFARRNVSVFLLGGLPGIAEAAANNLKKKIPGLQIAGTANGFDDVDNSRKLIQRINDARPDVLMIGMGHPLQEEWIASYGSELDVPVQWVVGAVYDFLAGKEPHAPAWMCRIGCQWLYRLAMDPLGKWRRYLLGNPLFIGRTLKEALCRWTRMRFSKPAVMGGGEIN